MELGESAGPSYCGGNWLALPDERAHYNALRLARILPAIAFSGVAEGQIAEMCLFSAWWDFGSDHGFLEQHMLAVTDGVDHETTIPKNEEEGLQSAQDTYPLEDARVCRAFDQGRVSGRIFPVQRTITPGRIEVVLVKDHLGCRYIPDVWTSTPIPTNTSMVVMLDDGDVPQTAFLHLGKSSTTIDRLKNRSSSGVRKLKFVNWHSLTNLFF